MSEKTDKSLSTLCIYFGAEKNSFDKLRAEVKALWFHKYGENLTIGKLLIMALESLKKSIEKESSNIGE